MDDKFQNKYRISSARLQNWDYGWNAPYFVTICTQNREHYFGEIVDGIMYFSEMGKIAQQFWHEIPDHFPFVILDAFVVMPNHIHGIIIINKTGDGRDDDGGDGCGNGRCNGGGDVETQNFASPRISILKIGKPMNFINNIQNQQNPKIQKRVVAADVRIRIMNACHVKCDGGAYFTVDEF